MHFLYPRLINYKNFADSLFNLIALLSPNFLLVFCANESLAPLGAGVFFVVDLGEGRVGGSG